MACFLANRSEWGLSKYQEWYAKYWNTGGDVPLVGTNCHPAHLTQVKTASAEARVVVQLQVKPGRLPDVTAVPGRAEDAIPGGVLPDCGRAPAGHADELVSHRLDKARPSGQYVQLPTTD